MSNVIHRMKDLPSTHLLGTGTPMCAGCGGLAGLHQIYDLLGTRTVFVNAAGCMTLLAAYPFTPFRGSWLYTAMASAPAGAQGVRDALDILLEQGRMPRDEDMTTVVLTGDGAAYGMGLSATSAAIERGLDFIYFCYDNEGYGNTGQQSSGATRGAHGDQPWQSRLQEGFVRHLGRASPRVCSYRDRRRTAGSCEEDPESNVAARPPPHSVAGALPARLGFRACGGGECRKACGALRRMAVERVCRRTDRAYRPDAFARSCRRLPEDPGPLPSSV
jgi:Thiamine pyrophosphate enzyme, C-terminal TPP binding domain